VNRIRAGATAARALAFLVVAAGHIAIAASAGTAGLRILDAREAPPSALVVDLPGLAPLPMGGEDAPIGYVLVAAGTLRLGLAAAPDLDTGPARLLAHLELELADGGYHTLVVVDAAAGVTATGARDDATPAPPPGIGPVELATVLLHDSLDRLPPAGAATLRIVHAAPHLGTLEAALWHEESAAFVADLQTGQPTRDDSRDTEADRDGAEIDGTLAPLTATGPLELAPGHYRLRTAVRGTGAESPQLVLRAGVIYTLLLVGLAEGALTVRLHGDAALPAPPHAGDD
jgi:hypothetical protein